MMTLRKIAKVIEHFTGKLVAEEVVVVSDFDNSVADKFHTNGTNGFIVRLNYADGSLCPETTCYVKRTDNSIEDFGDVFVESWFKHKLTFQVLPDEYFASNILGYSNEIRKLQSNLSSHDCNDATREQLEFCLKTKKLNEAWRDVRKFSMHYSEEEQELRRAILGWWGA